MGCINTYKYSIDRTPFDTFLSMCTRIDNLEKEKQDLLHQVDALQLEVDGGDEVLGYILRSDEGSEQLFHSRRRAQDEMSTRDTLLIVKKGDKVPIDPGHSVHD